MVISASVQLGEPGNVSKTCYTTIYGSNYPVKTRTGSVLGTATLPSGAHMCSWCRSGGIHLLRATPTYYADFGNSRRAHSYGETFAATSVFETESGKVGYQEVKTCPR